MIIDKNEINIKFTVREAQSLLSALRVFNKDNHREIGYDINQLPRGIKDDVKYIQDELEHLLLMK